MKFFIFKFYWVSRLFLIFVLLNFPTLSLANEFDSLISKYNNYSEEGNVKKSDDIFVELFNKYPSKIPLDILLKHGHIYIEQYQNDAYLQVHNLLLARINNRKDQNNYKFLRESMGSMASYAQAKSHEESSHDWIEDFRKNPTSYPSNNHELYLKNINDLKLSEVFFLTGEFIFTDAIISKLFVLNSMAKGKINKEIKKQFLWRILHFYNVTGRDRLSSIIMEKIDKLDNGRLILKNNHIYQGSSKEQELMYHFLNDDITSAKELVYDHFTEKKNGKQSSLLVDYQLLFQVATFCYVINDIEFLRFAKDKFKGMKVGIDFSEMLDVAILNEQYLSQKDFILTEKKLKNTFDNIKKLEKKTKEGVSSALKRDELIAMYINPAYMMFNLLAINILIDKKDYKTTLIYIKNVKSMWAPQFISGRTGFTLEGNNWSNIDRKILETLLWNIEKVENKDYKKKMYAEILEFNSKFKSSAEILLNMHITANNGSQKLKDEVREYEQLLNQRENFLISLIDDLIKQDELFKVQFTENQGRTIALHSENQKEKYENFVKSQNKLYLSIRRIKKIDPEFFMKIFSHTFKVKELQSLLKEKQSFYYYDFSENSILNCKITVENFDCKSKKINKNLMRRKINDFRNDILNRNIPDIHIKNYLIDNLFPYYREDKNKTIFLTLNSEHIGLPINFLLNSNKNYISKDFDLNEIVLVPSLGSSTFDFRNENKKYAGEYFGIGGAKYKKSNNIANLDKIFSIRSGINYQSLRELSYLPETLNEIKDVSRKFSKLNSKTLLGIVATEKNLRQESFGEYKYLHIATHGLISGELSGMNDSGLALTPGEDFTASGNNYALPSDDGILHASEIAKMNIISDTVILSACQTVSDFGKSNSNGINGLALSFLKSGSNKIIVSQWKVDDEFTKMIFKNSFVKNKNKTSFDLKNGINNTKKIKDAPYYWAPFIQISIPSNFNNEDKKPDYFQKKIKLDFDQYYISMYGSTNNKLSKINLIVPRPNDKFFIEVYQIESDLRNKEIKTKKIESIRYPFVIKDKTRNIHVNHTGFSLNSNEEWITSDIQIYDADKNIILDTIKNFGSNFWIARDGLLIKEKLHLLYMDGSKGKIKLLHIIYDLHKKKYKTYSLEREIKYNIKYRSLDIDSVRFVVADNEVLIAATNNEFRDGEDYFKFIKETQNWQACPYRDADTDIYTSKKNKIVFEKKLTNIQILSSENNSFKNSKILVRDVNSKDCSSKLYLTNLSMRNKIKIADGYNVKNAKLSTFNNKKYILINRAALVEGIDEVKKNNETIYHAPYYKRNFADSSGGVANHTLLWTNQVFRVSRKSYHVNPMQKKSTVDYKVDLISNSQGNYDSNQYSFLLSNNKIYTVGNKNGKFAIRYLDKF